MTSRSWMKPAFLLLVVSGLLACNKASPPPTQAKTVQYQVGSLVNGKFTAVGMLTFDENNQGRLRLTSEDGEARRLKEVWGKVSGLKVVTVKRGKPTEEGEELVGEEVARSSADFPQAIVDYLGNEHGFMAVKK